MVFGLRHKYLRMSNSLESASQTEHCVPGYTQSSQTREVGAAQQPGERGPVGVCPGDRTGHRDFHSLCWDQSTVPGAAGTTSQVPGSQLWFRTLQTRPEDKVAEPKRRGTSLSSPESQPASAVCPRATRRGVGFLKSGLRTQRACQARKGGLG